MKLILFVLLSISSIFAQDCLFQSENGDYDLTTLYLSRGNAYHYFSEKSGKDYYFNLCGAVNNLLDKTGNPIISSTSSSVVSIDKNNEILSLAGTSISMDYDYNHDLVSASYQQGSDKCYVNEQEPGYPYQVLADFVCYPDAYIAVYYVDDSDPCRPRIVMNSSLACPESEKSYYKHTYPVFMMSIAICAACCASVCVLCACCLRKKSAGASKQLNSHNKVELRNVTLDLDMEDHQQLNYAYPGHQQQLYFYPNSQVPQYIVNQQVPLEETTQVKLDEQLARKLQQSFDNE